MEHLPPRYHGNLVRKLFLSASFIMIVALPFLNSRLPVPATISLLAIMAVDIFAGLTNPMKRWTVGLDTVAAIVGTLVFEYYAVAAYDAKNILDPLFIINQLLALLFIAALYYSTKTYRAMALRGRGDIKYE